MLFKKKIYYNIDNRLSFQAIVLNMNDFRNVEKNTVISCFKYFFFRENILA